jgi:small subunit ribosomal protein S16
MAVKIRLQRKGRRKNPFYHIVIADARSPRDGRFIEKLGVYNPMTKPATIDIDRDKAYDWLLKGAQPTDTVRAILRFKGVMYRKHLMRGVNKGAMTQEDADRLYQEWIDAKESKIASRVEETKKEIKKRHENIFGVPVAKKAPEPEPAPEVEEPVAEAVEEAAEEVTEVAEAEAPAVEAAAEEPAAEAEEEKAE